MEKIIYIFLDVDGVLNNESYTKECFLRHKKPMNTFGVPFDPKCLNNLMILVNELEKNDYQVKIILSSSWRVSDIGFAIVNARLQEYGLHLTDKTPYVNFNRGEEIKEYLLDNSEYINYIIIDDSIRDIILLHPNNVVHTELKDGFNDTCLKEALEIGLRKDIKDARVSRSRNRKKGFIKKNIK